MLVFPLSSIKSFTNPSYCKHKGSPKALPFSGAKNGPGASAIRLSDERDSDPHSARKLRPQERGRRRQLRKGVRHAGPQRSLSEQGPRRHQEIPPEDTAGGHLSPGDALHEEGLDVPVAGTV